MGEEGSAQTFVTKQCYALIALATGKRPNERSKNHQLVLLYELEKNISLVE